MEERVEATSCQTKADLRDGVTPEVREDIDVDLIGEGVENAFRTLSLLLCQ